VHPVPTIGCADLYYCTRPSAARQLNYRSDACPAGFRSETTFTVEALQGIGAVDLALALPGEGHVGQHIVLGVIHQPTDLVGHLLDSRATRLKSLRRARQLVEPPTADPHGGWCGGRGRATSGYPIRPRSVGKVTLAYAALRPACDWRWS